MMRTVSPATILDSERSITIELDELTKAQLRNISQSPGPLAVPSSERSTTSSKSPSKRSNSGKTGAKKVKQHSKKSSIEDKPKRPLSAYNIFFKYARTRILQGVSDEDMEGTPEEARTASITAIRENSTKPRGRRNNRKTHGQIGFGDLARKIASHWKSVSKGQRDIFEHYASIDMKRYRKEISVWKAKKEAAILNARTNYSSRPPLLESSVSSFSTSSTDSTSSFDSEWSLPQHRSIRMNTSFSSIDSDNSSVNGSNNESFLEIEQPMFVAARKSRGDHTTSNNNNNISQNSSDIHWERNHSGRNNNIPKNVEMDVHLKNLYLEELIVEMKKELCSMRVSMGNHYNNNAPPHGGYNDNHHQHPFNVPMVSGGPSIERMQQLHRHRQLKGDFMHNTNNSRSSTTSVASSQPNSRDNSMRNGFDFDPIPFDQVFFPEEDNHYSEYSRSMSPENDA